MNDYRVENDSETTIPDWLEEKIIKFVKQRRGETNLTYNSYSQNIGKTFCYEIQVDDKLITILKREIKEGELTNDPPLQSARITLIKEKNAEIHTNYTRISNLEEKLRGKTKEIENLKSKVNSNHKSLEKTMKYLTERISKLEDAFYRLEEKIK